MDITKAIIPAAGLGTRFLPLTKAIPKEMIPILNKPAIHYIVEEGIKSNINQFLIITDKNKQAISDYLDLSPELYMTLKERGKEQLLSEVSKLIRMAHFTYIRQPEPLGLGHAVWMARHSIGKEYFGIFLPDDIMVTPDPALAQLIRIARQEKASVIAVQEVPSDCVSAYGIVDIKKQITPNLFQVANLVEKPNAKDAPSNLAIVGRYVLSHKIFKAIDEVSGDALDELQLTDGMSQMMRNGEKVFAYKVSGARYDVGNPTGWVKAVIGIALQHPQYGPAINDYINDLNTTTSFVYNKQKNITHTLP